MKGKIEYKKFLDEIYNDKPIEDYPLLEKYRKNIKLLLSQYLVDSYIDNDYGLWSKYVDRSIELAIEMNDTIISYKLIKKLFELDFYSPIPLELIDVLESVYCPTLVKDFNAYLNSCNLIYLMFIYYLDDNIIVDVKHEELNGFFKFISDLEKPVIYVNNKMLSKIPSSTDLYSEDPMISFLFAYLHYHGIRDYSLIIEYLNNIEYYKEKMGFNDCIIYDEYDGYGSGKYIYDKARILFDNVESFFTRDKGNIK